MMVKRAPKIYSRTINGLKNSVTRAIDFMPPTITSQVSMARPKPDIQGFIPSSEPIATAIELDCTMGIEKRALHPMNMEIAPAIQGSFSQSGRKPHPEH